MEFHFLKYLDLKFWQFTIFQQLILDKYNKYYGNRAQKLYKLTLNEDYHFRKSYYIFNYFYQSYNSIRLKNYKPYISHPLSQFNPQ